MWMIFSWLPRKKECYRKFIVLVEVLQQKGLHIAPEMIQQDKAVSYLGSKMTHDQIIPQKVELRKDQLCTLNNFQKLLGDINWVRDSLGIANYELKPLYDILIGDAALDLPKRLTDEAR